MYKRIVLAVVVLSILVISVIALDRFSNNNNQKISGQAVESSKNIERTAEIQGPCEGGDCEVPNCAARRGKPCDCQ